MRDAVGGTVNLVIIVIFMAIVSGYLAFNVNYTKAFRVKNKIISALEQYEGNCDTGTACSEVISKYMSSIGYSKTGNFELRSQDGEHAWNCPNGYGYCYKRYDLSSCNGEKDLKKRAYFKVVTRIKIDIPVFNNLMPSLKMFQVSGDTKPIVIGECD